MFGYTLEYTWQKNKIKDFIKCVSLIDGVVMLLFPNGEMRGSFRIGDD